MKIKTMILDDDRNSRLAAKTALSKFDSIEITGEFENSEEMFEYLKTGSADLLFLDIELREEMGFDIAKQLRREYPGLMIVFLTGHSSYAIDGYDFQPINFLTKPINVIKLKKTVAEAESRLKVQVKPKNAKIMFRLKKGHAIIDISDICYIERTQRKNYLNTADKTIQISGYTMHELEDIMEEHGFFMCHQSYIISLYRVTAVRDTGRQLYEVTLKGCKTAIPVSRGRYEELMKQLSFLNIHI